MRILFFRFPLVFLCFCSFFFSLDAQVVKVTRSWDQTDAGFSACNKRIATYRGHNLLARDGVKVVESKGFGYGSVAMLFDGTAGERLGDGRVGFNGKPAVLTFYLGEPKEVIQVGVFTFNSDARANQDFEVRFADNAASPGVKPSFPKTAHVTTGDTVLGKNTGGFHVFFSQADGGPFVRGKVDWIQFRFWPTYNVKAGSPAKEKTKAQSWTSLIELEVRGDPHDVIWVPEIDIAARREQVKEAFSRVYKKQDTWQDTLMHVCNAIEKGAGTTSGPAGFEPFISEVVTGASEPLKIEVPVAGLERIWLEVDVGGDTYDYDQAVWGDAMLLDRDGRKVPLTDLKPVFVEVGWGSLFTDKDHTGKKLQVGGRTFARGLWAHGPSRLCYQLGRNYTRFSAWAGIGETAGSKGSVRFKVLRLPSAANVMETVWARIRKDFPAPQLKQEMSQERSDGIWESPWPPGDYSVLAGRYAAAAHRHPALQEAARKRASKAHDAESLAEVRGLYHRSRRFHTAFTKVQSLQWDAVRRAVEDLIATFGDAYPQGPALLGEIAQQEKLISEIKTGNVASMPAASDLEKLEETARKAQTLARRALLANPLLDFDRLLVVKRKPNRLGLPANWQSNSSISKTGYDNEIDVVNLRNPQEALQMLFRPGNGEYVGEVDLHYNADRLLFSMPSEKGAGPWHIFELAFKQTAAGSTAAGELRRVTQTEHPAVNNYDACYLPDDRIVFTSTAGMVAVPCVRGSSHVATLFRMNPDGSDMRQLCFDQEHSWYPAVTHEGQILYTRWEYTDLPHSNSRMLFRTNPDGTDQRALYGSNSFWPNSIFYARPVPGHPTKIVATITGHHAPPRKGELIIFDPARGTHEADGVVQRIPGYGEKVEPIIRDGLTGGSWPKFLHPYPLNEHYFLVSAKMSAVAPWAVYLVDVFDNMILIREEPGYALLEPVPVKKTTRPPVVPDRVDLARDDGVVCIADIYMGPGLKGIPRGEVKELRLYTYTFGYHGVGGLYGSIGMDGPWDMRRTLGTVPVEKDGSASFKVPANTPIALQPLDSEGKALQIMRSWLTVMPGESLSCVGCHEHLREAPLVAAGAAMQKPPAEITPWRGPPRNYEFQREVQPVIDRHCVSCHDGSDDSEAVPDLRGTKMITSWTTRMAGNTGRGTGGKFSVAYTNLHRFVRRPGIESPMPLMTPMEFHADTTELVQLLLKGHYGVKLDDEAWDRLITWIDFNAPYHGRWSTIVGDSAVAKENTRAELRKQYASLDENHEVLPDMEPVSVTPASHAGKYIDQEKKSRSAEANAAGWPFTSEEAKKRQQVALDMVKNKPGKQADEGTGRIVDLGNGVAMKFVYVPGGSFIMGSWRGYDDEAPRSPIVIKRCFWMSSFEVTNEQFRVFNPGHDSREEDRHGYQFGIPGYDVNKPEMPAVRLSWREAQEFCAWLSDKLGRRAALPTEAQWEWACRAGSAEPFFYGDFSVDFSAFANLGDITLADFSGNPYEIDPKRGRYGNVDNPYDNWIPQDKRFNDGGFVSEEVGRYRPNAWGLYDMHGNAAEWTRSCYKPYPYSEADGRNEVESDGISLRVVRGGSWYDRPKRCTASYRWRYRDYQKVYNVGFRVVLEEGSQR